MKAATEKKYTKLSTTAFNDASNRQADKALREMDRVLRWRKVHDLIRKHNKKARKEQDETAKDCAYFRKEKLIRQDKTELMGLRWGVAIPTITWHALVQGDNYAEGHSDLSSPDKEGGLDLKATNSIVKDLEKAFPQYRVS